jgi:hypothetical protein
MPRTRTGKRSAWFGVQIVEEPGGSILLFFEKHDMAPIAFSARTGAVWAKSTPQAQVHPRQRRTLSRRHQVDEMHSIDVGPP